MSSFKVLTWSVVLGFVHIVESTRAKSLQRGYRWTASARDEPVPALTGTAGRLARALNNYLETFPLFAVLVLAAQVAGVHDALTLWGSFLFLGARVVYLPLYALGIPLLRSLVWNVATVGMLLFVVALLRARVVHGLKRGRLTVGTRRSAGSRLVSEPLALDDPYRAHWTNPPATTVSREDLRERVDRPRSSRDDDYSRRGARGEPVLT